MKHIKLLAACALTIGSLIPLSAQDNKAAAPAAPAAPAPAAAPAIQYTDEQIAETFGWFIGRRMGLAELGFTKEQAQAASRGLLLAADGKESPYELEKIGPMIDGFMQKKQQAYQAKLKAESEAKNTEFFAKLKENKNIIELPSGLRYEVIKPGTGAFPKATDIVRVNYTGKLISGEVFDTNMQPGPTGEPGQPAQFALNGVIPGWTEGLQKINAGGKIMLYVPHQLGYGEAGNQGIPPAATLIFEVELLEIVPPPPAPAPEAPAAPAAKK